MKFILRSLLFLIIGALVFGAVSLRDNPKDFELYQEYVSNLSSFETEYGTMRYHDEGTGPAILLVHGVPTNSWMYRKLASQLAASGYRVIVPDLMGFGASDRMDIYDHYDFENQATILIALMSELGIENWQQVTHDMGGLVTWHMVRDQANRIDHLFVLNTIIYRETFNPPADFNHGNKFHNYILSLHSHPVLGKLIVNNMLRTGTGKHNYASSDRAGYWLPLRDGVESLVHFFTHTKEVKEDLDEYRAWLVESEVPVSVIWGEGDPFLDISSVVFLRDELNLSNEDVLILPDAKHLVAEESYLEIAEFIINKNN